MLRNNHKPGFRRKLTEGEIGMAKSILEDALNLLTIEVLYENYITDQTSGTFMTPDEHIYVPKDYRIVRDFSLGYREDIKAIFIHELVHVYQSRISA